MRIGIDLGGTKIAVIALGNQGEVRFEQRTATPRGDYAASLAAIRDLVAAAEAATGRRGTVGIGMPGSLSPVSGRVQNANSTWLNGRPFKQDVEHVLGREVRLANDANCFALSEAIDGAAAGARSVFGVIIGTGCGGGLVFERQLIDGPRGIGGEWGHNPLPWMTADEHPGPACWCGLAGCLETFLSGPGLAADHTRHGGAALTAAEIAELAQAGNAAAEATLARHASRLARGLAGVVNIFDPEVIVLGGGLSNMPHLYERLPPLMAPYLFAEDRRVDIRPPHHGDASGVRGAAWLWPLA
jgi:fructokinase